MYMIKLNGAKHSPLFLQIRGPFGLDPEVLRVHMGKSCFHQFRSRYQLWRLSRTISHFRLSKVIFRTSVNCWSSCRKVRPRKKNAEILGVLKNEIFMISGRLQRVPEVFFYLFGAQLRKANDYKSMVRSTLLLFSSSGVPSGWIRRFYEFVWESHVFINFGQDINCGA